MPVEPSRHDLFSALFPTSSAAPATPAEESSGSGSVFAQQLSGAITPPAASVVVVASETPVAVATSANSGFTFGTTGQIRAEGESAQDPAALLQTLLATLARLGSREELPGSEQQQPALTTGASGNTGGEATSGGGVATPSGESPADQEPETAPTGETETALFSSVSALLATLLAATPLPGGQNTSTGTTTGAANPSTGLASRPNEQTGTDVPSLLTNPTDGTAAESTTTGTAVTTSGAPGSSLTGAPLRLRQQLFGQTPVDAVEPPASTDDANRLNAQLASPNGAFTSGAPTAQTSNNLGNGVGTATPVLSNQFASVSQSFAPVRTSGATAINKLLTPQVAPVETNSALPVNGVDVKQPVSQAIEIGPVSSGVSIATTDARNPAGASQTQHSVGVTGSDGSTLNSNSASVSGSVTTAASVATPSIPVVPANETTVPVPVVTQPEPIATTTVATVSSTDGSTSNAEQVGAAAVATIDTAAVSASAAQAATSTGLAESIARTEEETAGSLQATDQIAQRNRALGLVAGSEQTESVVNAAARTELAPSIANRLSERLGRLTPSSSETTTRLAEGISAEERALSEVWSAGTSAGASGISLKFAAALSNSANSTGVATSNTANIPVGTLEPVAGGIGQAVESGEGLSIILTPPDLGMLRIEVRSGAGGVEARLETSTDHATRLLGDHLPWLQDALQQRGTTVDRIEIQQVNPDRWSAGERAFAETGGQAFQDSRRPPQSQTPQPELLPSIDVSTTNERNETRPAGPPRRWDRINLHV